MNVGLLIRKYTLEQWTIIDSEYLEPNGVNNRKGIIPIILVVVLLIVKRYYGSNRTFSVLSGNVSDNWPYPDIWPYIYGVFTSILLFLVIPGLFIKFFLRERIRDYGFTFKDILKYKWIYLAMIIVVVPLVIIASQLPSFASKYPLYPQAKDSLPKFLIWEFAYGLYFLALEFLFRGFMIFALARYIGAYAIFVMVIPYVMIHFGKPVAETFGSIIAGAALGTLALRTRSIFGGLFIHVLIAWSMDLLAIFSCR